MAGGKSFYDELQVTRINEPLPSSSVLGTREDPVQYGPRTSLTVDGPDMQGRVVLYEPFASLPQRLGASALVVPNQHFGIVGTNAATALQSFTESGVLITTAGANNDSAIASPLPGVTLWDAVMSASLRPLARLRFKLGDVTSVRYEFGVRATVTAMDDTTDNDKMIVRFDTSDGVVSSENFVLVTSAGGVEMLEDTGVEAVANRDYVFTLAVDADRNVFLFSCDLSGAATGDEAFLVNTPADHQLAAASIGTPYGGALARTAAGRAFRLQGFVRSQAI